MSIRPIDFSGMVQRTQDVSTLKQNADNKPTFDQQLISVKMQKDTQQSSKQVTHGEDAENYQKKYDARDKGSNEYVADRRKKDKKDKKENKKDGTATSALPRGSFDIKI